MIPAPAQLFVGTSGFSYTSWRGSFYPRGVKPEEMLGHYAGRLATVEVNTTFYRTQPDDVVAGWAADGGDVAATRGDVWAGGAPSAVGVAGTTAIARASAAL